MKQDNCPEEFSEKVIMEFVNAKVAPYKKLRGGIRFVASVPKSASGKLLRRVQIETCLIRLYEIHSFSLLLFSIFLILKCGKTYHNW